MTMLDEIQRYWEEDKAWMNRCFLCGERLGENPSQEHVFPRWLQRLFLIQSQRLTLLNSTTIPYRQVRVPCCPSCNSRHLSRLERAVSQALRSGFDAFVELGFLTVFAWTAKLLYGILYKEMSLALERRTRSSEAILTKEFLEECRSLHLFLQRVRWPIDFANFQPASIFVFRMHETPVEYAFDFHNTLVAFTVMLRMNDVGVIVAFDDTGIVKEFYSDFERAFGKSALHPVQLREFAAMITYRAILMNRVPKYVTVESPDTGEIKCLALPLQGYGSTPLFDCWDPLVYARILSRYLQPVAPLISIDPSVENLQGPKGTTMTFLGHPPDVFLYSADGTRIS